MYFMVLKAAVSGKNEDVDVATVWREEKIAGDFEECCLCSVSRMETRLKWFKKNVVGTLLFVGLDLRDNNTFQGF